MRDVGEEWVAGADREGRVDRSGRVARHQAGACNELREACERVGNEFAIGVGCQQRHVESVEIVEHDAEQVARLRLHDGPGGHPAKYDVIRGAEEPIGAQIAIYDQLARCDRITGGVELVRAQEHLVRGMRGVGLVLIDERGRLVGVLVNVVGGAKKAVRPPQVGGPRQHHEVGRAARNEERIVRLERNEDRATAALVQEIEAMVEELAEEREPRVERRGQARVRCHVRNEENRLIVSGAKHTIQAGARDDLGAIL
ncbi:hypothetical protein LP414_20250 [Polaromonas sp. P1(28)-13]|nr:hypothetical protein LP414_20250 [Polaromonas sp. P1(28)-13]